MLKYKLNNNGEISTLQFSNEDNSTLASSEDQKADVKVIRILQHPKEYGFQRKGGISTDIDVIFR